MTACLTIWVEHPEQLAPMWAALKDAFPGVPIGVDIDPDTGLDITVDLIPFAAPDGDSGHDEDIADEDTSSSEPAPVETSGPPAAAAPGAAPAPTPSDGWETFPPPVPDRGDLPARVVAHLDRLGPSPAQDIASHLTEDRADVMDALRALKDEGRVRSAGVRGWALDTRSDPIRATRFDPEAARRRAAEAV